MVSLKPGLDGQRRRKKVSGTNKTEVRAKLAELHDELNDGVVTNAAYTVAQAINDWLADRLAGRAAKTVSTQRELLEPLIDIIGAAAPQRPAPRRSVPPPAGHARSQFSPTSPDPPDPPARLSAGQP